MNATLATLRASPETNAPPAWGAFVPGERRDMPAEEYFAVEAMSQSGARKILKTPAHFKLSRTMHTPPTPQQILGTAIHDGVLEPDLFHERIMRMPDFGDMRSSTNRTTRDAFIAANAGRVVLTLEDYITASECARAVRAHPSASKLLDGAIVESSLFWLDAEYKVPCKARLDARNRGGIIDLKSTRDASPEEFAKSAANFGYHIQGAQYWSACEHVLNESPLFFAIIAVETEPPYAVACYHLPPNELLMGRHLMDEALARYRDALASDRWAGYPTTIEPLPFPRWALKF